MRKDLRDKAIESAAARYGAEHYRGLLFMTTFGKWWPVGLVIAVVIGLSWLTGHTSPSMQTALLFGIVAVGAVVLMCWLGIRSFRSPYRRRRYRG